MNDLHEQDAADEAEAMLFMERSVMCAEVTLSGQAARRIARYISNLQVESDNDLAEITVLSKDLMGVNEELVAQNAAVKTESARLAKDLGEARAKLQHVCEIMATLNEPGLKDVLLEMHAYLFPEATAVRIAATEEKP